MNTNEKLGLPFQSDGKMQKIIFAFDVDGTLIDSQGRPRPHYVSMLISLHKAFKNSRIVVWSGGGTMYAEQRGRELGIDEDVWRYMSKMQHTELRAAGYWIIAIDDIQDTAIGDLNLIVRQ